QTLSGFRGLPHRLQHVGQQAEIDYYNDSLATTPDATIAAVRALEQPIILIAGGASKKADFAHLAQVISRTSVHSVLLLGDEGPR
ncbi:MAG: glutamate ligase domain-containing protein, partial [Candidatus Latescibacterota bacterium]